MLVLISDLHLGDGTTGSSIPTSAFQLFAKRLRLDAHFASAQGERYRAIEELDVILLGDILEVLHSNRWLYAVGDETRARMTRPDASRRIGLHPPVERPDRPKVCGKTT